MCILGIKIIYCSNQSINNVLVFIRKIESNKNLLHLMQQIICYH